MNLRSIAAAISLLAMATAARSGVLLSEDIDSVAALVAEGWIVSDASAPPGTTAG